jgi:hypothetical protein
MQPGVHADTVRVLPHAQATASKSGEDIVHPAVIRDCGWVVHGLIVYTELRRGNYMRCVRVAMAGLLVAPAPFGATNNRSESSPGVSGDLVGGLHMLPPACDYSKFVLVCPTGSDRHNSRFSDCERAAQLNQAAMAELQI